MKLKYDLHIHTALSPCALDEMTPNNVVNMAVLNELDIIGICDHNTNGNVSAVVKAAETLPIIALPGMEVETKEEIHVVCLFGSVEASDVMQQYVFEHLPLLKNKPKVLGKQVLMDDEDEIIGEEERLLSFATDLSYETIIEKAWELGGIAVPAHVDRPSYSVISNLGILPDNDKTGILEVSVYAKLEEEKEKFPKHMIIQCSDAHELGYVGLNNQFIELDVEEPLSAQRVIQALRKMASRK